MSIVLITGGARSGKSTFAENYCKKISQQVTYIACGKITDEEMANRVKMHQAQRPKDWTTVEAYRGFETLFDNLEGDVFLLDCITTMVTNIMFDFDLDYDTCTQEEIDKVEKEALNEVECLLKNFKDSKKTLVAVTNEVGMGLVPSYRLGRIFRDIAGRINQYIAGEADNVYCMISGLEMKLK